MYRKINKIPHREDDFSHLGGVNGGGGPEKKGIMAFLRIFVEEFKNEFKGKK